MSKENKPGKDGFLLRCWKWMQGSNRSPLLADILDNIVESRAIIKEFEQQEAMAKTARFKSGTVPVRSPHMCYEDTEEQNEVIHRFK